MKTKSKNTHSILNFRKHIFRKVLAFGLSVSLLAAYPLYPNSGNPGFDSLTAYANGTNVPNKEKLIKNGTILHCFSWSFDTIREKLPDIKAAGYTAIQTSPVNAVARGKDTQMKLMGTNPDTGNHDGEYGAWYWHYQPTDWKIGNWQLGSKEQFTAMVEEADRLGIQVLVDVVPNHTTPLLDQISPDFVNAVGGWDDMYHENAHVDVSLPLKTNNSTAGTIRHFNDRLECTSKSLLTLADVNTENPSFQAYYLNYLNELIDIGVDGFRYDTGKHIALPSDPRDPKTAKEGQTNDFWEVATGRQSVNGVTLKDKDNLFIYGEILQDTSVSDTGYTKYVYMTASNYGKTLRSKLAVGNSYDEHYPGVSADLDNVSLNAGELTGWSHANPDKIVTWVESHDTYFNEGESAHLSDQKIRFGWAAIAAREKGTPLFFSRPAGSDGWNNRFGNNVLGVAGNDEFMHPEVREVNLFRQAMGGQPEYLRSHWDGKVYQIDRGTEGSVIINADIERDVTLPTTMAVGNYKDHVSGEVFQVVQNGNERLLQGKLKAGAVAVIYKADAELNAVNSINKPFFFDQHTEVTLTAQNTVNNRYITSNGKSGSFTSGDKVLLTSSAENTAFIILTGTKSDGTQIEKRVEFSRIQPLYDVYFEKHDSWTDVGMHAYAENGPTTQWPGIAMVPLGHNLYGAKIPEDILNARGNTMLIFANVRNAGGTLTSLGDQDPGSGSGFFLYDETKFTPYFYDKDVQEHSERWKPIHLDFVHNFQPLIVNLEADNHNPVEGEAVSFTASVSGGNSNGSTAGYRFKFTVIQNGQEEVVQNFSENPVFSWAKPLSGNAYIKVEANDSFSDAATKTIALHWSAKEDIAFDRNYDVYFQKPAGWRRNSIHVYAYKPSGSGVTELSAWPGEPMTYIDGDVYGYKLPEDKKDYLVIFNDAENGADSSKQQYPYDGQPGLPAIKGGSMYLESFGNLESKAWRMVAKDPIQHVTLTASAASPQTQNTPVTFTANAAGGVGNLKYRFSKVEGAVASSSNAQAIYSVIQDFSDSNTLTLTSDEAKTYTIKVEVKDSSSDYHYTDTTAAFAGTSIVFAWEADPNEPAQPPVNPSDPAQPPVNPSDPAQPPVSTTDPAQPASPSNADQTTQPPTVPDNPNQPPVLPPSTTPDIPRSIPHSTPRQRRIYHTTYHLSTPFIGTLDYATSTNFWFRHGNRWMAMEKDGTHAVNSWKHFEWLGKRDWYYFDQNGYMLTGWQQIDGKWYYLDSSGKLLTDTVTPDGYDVNVRGEWIQGNRVPTNSYS